MVEYQYDGVPVAELWQAYWTSRDSHYEDLLCRAYLPRAKQVAERLLAQLPAAVDRQEVEHDALFGLLDAIRNFDPDKAQFQTYATIRMESRIRDGLRRNDPLSRDLRGAVRRVQRAIEDLESRWGRSPSNAEVAEHLGVGVEEVERALVNNTNCHVDSLDQLLPDRGDSSGTIGLRLSDGTDRHPHDGIEQEQDEDAVRDAIATLPVRDQQVLALYYYERLTLRHIAEILGVTESRISQVHAKALIVLRTRLRSARMA